MKNLNNDVLKEVHNLIDRQTEKGIKKYGHSVDYNEFEAIEWINHAKEEVADLLVYLTCLEFKIKNK